MRALIAVLVNSALLLTLAEAPSLHTHRHETTQRHQGSLFHLHLKALHVTGANPAFRDLDPDDDAQMQSWLSATPADSGLTPVVLVERFDIPPPERDGWIIETPRPAGHDPPLLNTSSPRAPPA